MKKPQTQFLAGISMMLFALTSSTVAAAGFGTGTTITNNPPSFTEDPSDGGSSATIPTNSGANVTFTATATDSNNDQYYLAICKTDSATAGADTAPTCDSGQTWTISTATNSGSQASALYTTTYGDAESNEWYAFVCDKNPSGICSASSQGTGDNGSPFVVNQSGTFGTATVTNTSDSSTIVPGDTLKFKLAHGTITAGGNVNMYICSSSTTSFDYSANSCNGGNMICSAANVDPTSQDATCQESGNNLVPIPTSHGTKNFKIYVKDIRDLPATGTNSQSYDVEDVRPVLDSPSYPSHPAPSTLTAGGSISYTFTVGITDNNGDGDVTAVKGVFFDKNAVTHSCTSNDNNCYIQNTCTLSGVDGDNALLATCTIPSIWYNANASDWDIEAVATDGNGPQEFSDGGFNLTIGALSALDVPEGSIAYGSVAIGYVSAKTTTTIANMGNQPLDISLSGSPMTSGGNSISANMQKWYHTNTDFNWSATPTAPGPYNLVETANQGCTLGVDCGDAQGCLNRNILVRGSDHTATSTNESIYWKLKIPESQAIGSYSGTNTFSAEIHGQCAGGQSY